MKLSAVIIGCFFVLAGCDLSDSDDSSGPAASYTNEERAEAYNAALWYTGDMEPADSIVNLHLYYLKSIRTRFIDSVISAEIPFIAPWTVGKVLVKWESVTADSIYNGTYTGWNTLPPDLRPIDSTKYPILADWSALGFQKPLHPRRLSDTYKALRGVITAEPETQTYSFGYARLVPCLVGGKNAYYFYMTDVGVEAGDYFKVIDGVPQHIGGWNSRTDSVPSWYGEIRSVIDHFETWDGY